MNDTIKTILLYPLSRLYALIVSTRNKLFDLDILHSVDTPLPTISIGNITVGGTGKTPHSEYIISLLQNDYKLAYLSRGYRRGSRGFQLSNEQSTSHQLGDEAQQIHKKFPNITVAVDSDRLNALRKIEKQTPTPDLVILDDAYQHRNIHPDLNILLIDYNRLTYNDDYLPLGRLRESYKNTDRADIIIITKCPTTIRPVDMLSVRVQIEPYPYQSLYFTNISHGTPEAIFGGVPLDMHDKQLLVVTGICQPQHMHEYIQQYTEHIITMNYPDHHIFTSEDIKKIENKFDTLEPENRAILITAKDRARLDTVFVPDKLKPYMYSIDIEINFIFNQQEKFDQQIKKFVKKRVKNRQ